MPFDTDNAFTVYIPDNTLSSNGILQVGVFKSPFLNGQMIAFSNGKPQQVWLLIMVLPLYIVFSSGSVAYCIIVRNCVFKWGMYYWDIVFKWVFLNGIEERENNT